MFVWYRPASDITDVYERRQATYAQVATLTVNVDDRPPEEIAAGILAAITQPRQAPGASP